MHNEYMKRSGMARVLKEFHSSQFSRNRSSAIGMSHTCRCCCHSTVALQSVAVFAAKQFWFQGLYGRTGGRRLQSWQRLL